MLMISTRRTAHLLLKLPALLLFDLASTGHSLRNLAHELRVCRVFVIPEAKGPARPYTIDVDQELSCAGALSGGLPYDVDAVDGRHGSKWSLFLIDGDEEGIDDGVFVCRVQKLFSKSVGLGEDVVLITYFFTLAGDVAGVQVVSIAFEVLRIDFWQGNLLLLAFCPGFLECGGEEGRVG